ncbi:oligosaccharide flippase family protein [Rhizobiaceae bacterium n13]|uniref:Oligosaccharide flippase family protein n=1 Tax=Ferirhizobium litorale TaxID=2927786 RepID=A0AAE3QHM6_9HYPH|nr:oligosaccharide flippase family protein [Fererhizobium litorale]MDI7862980.1 oligosaccharide flippase family protein [Fererhizobium litorale]MDI7924053.1 oligosaccharide flippase family protein [Fererhizobium litorale]
MLAVKAIKGAGWLVFSRFVGRIIDFFTLLVFARVLSPADFGLVALATSLVVVVDTMLEVPVTQALVRLPTIDKSHLDTGFTVGLLRGILIGAVILAAAWPYSLINHDSDLIMLAGVLALGPISRGLASPAMVNFARQLGFHQTFILEFLGKLTASLIAMLIVLSGGAYWAIVANFVITSLVSTTASYMLAPYRPAISLKHLPDFAGFIGWYSSAQLISALNWQFDRFLIGALADRPTLGRYAIASDVAVIPTQSLIGPALQPMMAAFSKINTDRARLRHAFLKATRFAMLISTPACLGISLTADLATDLLLGKKWEQAAPLLSLLALSMIPVPYLQTLSSVSVALGKPHVIFRLNAIDLSFRVVLISIGFYLGSVTGVSYARIGLSAMMLAFYLNETRRLLEINIAAQLRSIWKVAPAAIAMTVVVWLVRGELSGRGYPQLVELALVIAAGAGTYAAALLLLGIRLIIGPGRLELIDR